MRKATLRRATSAMSLVGLAGLMGLTGATAVHAQVSPGIVGTTTPKILATTAKAFPRCVAWRPKGVCFFLRCTPFGCSIRTSLKISHYVPDLIVSSYNDTLNHPWTDIGKPVSTLFKGAGASLLKTPLDASATTAREDREIVTFKTVDAIGNPLADLAALAAGSGAPALPSSISIPNPQELMQFPATELPRILRLWATVPMHVGNTMVNDARAIAQNPASLIHGITSLPGQLGAIQTPFGSVGDMISNGLSLDSLGIGGGGGGGSGGGNGQGNFGLNPAALQGAIMSVAGGAGGDLFCPGGSRPFNLYYQSDLDSWFWRAMIPLDMLYPQAWIPGFGEVGNMLTNTWGSLYPRTGELVQSHPAKSSAVLSARVHSIVSQPAQAHIYKKLQTPGGYKYFARFADPRWQPIHPVPENRCVQFGTNDSLGPLSWRDFKTASTDGYIWNLWTRYECCKSRGKFLFSIP